MSAPVATAVPTTGPIAVDGRLDEPDWQTAPAVTDFVRFRPTDGGPPAGTTEVRFLEDATALYVGIRVRGVDYRVRARVCAREDINDDDQIGLFFDPYRDHANGYAFWLNPLGIQQDLRLSGPGYDPYWDTVFSSKGRVVADGYDLEVAIPWRSLKFPRGADTWGVVIQRKAPAKGEYYVFPKVQRNAPRAFDIEADLVGLKPPSRGSGLEVEPSLTVSQNGSRTDPTQPLAWDGLNPWYEAIRPSLDLRYGLTPNIGLTATVNPDFSEVEGDVTPIHLNQQFAFSFPEHRPFFVDGADFLADPEGTLYTRSIVEPLYGLKAFGKEGPWSVGFLHALDRSPQPTVNEAPTPGFEAADVAGAWAVDTIGRVKHDVLQGGYVGLTLAEKDLVGPGSHEQAGGLDGAFPLGNRWTTYAHSQYSHVEGDGQQLGGFDNGAELQRASGIGTGFDVAVDDRTPGLREEMGFQPLSGVTVAKSSLNYTFEGKGAWQTFEPELDVGGQRERNGEDQQLAGGSFLVGFARVHAFQFGTDYVEYSEQAVRTRGAKAFGTYQGEAGAFLLWTLSADYGRELDYATLVPADAFHATLDFTLHPTPGIRFDGEAQHQRLWPQSGDPQIAQLYRGKLTWQFTPAFGLRTIGEYTIGSLLTPRLQSSILLTWLDHPGTAIYLGYTETTDLVAKKALDRTIFAKGSILFRP